MIKDNILVSVIIPAFNVEETIEECLISVANQAYSHIEVIVIDDGSSDATTSVVESFILTNKFLKFSIFIQENQGPSKARNVGIEKARGEFVVFMDADDRVDPSYIVRCLEMFKRKPSLNLVYSGIRNFGRENNAFLFNAFEISSFLRANVIPIFAMVRREQVMGVGGFDESLKNHEDWELWIRIIQKFGAHVYQIPEHLYFYRKREVRNSITDLSQASQTIEQSFYYIYKKHYAYYLSNKLGIHQLFLKAKYQEKYNNVWYRKLYYLLFPNKRKD
ncbi:glycosyltransferase family 2 protein [Sphingobacterium psychroaquaticum]|uniref:Glycosyltransferase involved in cell wall bisynthesis n=1 Tax=Sphingobacterium psychroaquaticum TaxID=561061 RepID=A0A1X7L501_9SPHI|nr:glycosyltransferase family A protein [Sphingobacterium psychroaquaticum]QBQ42228.1 glycosyltransferase family 2 protein [Sphingobacterium psychroaquaticum]SMG48463.1 Glycosyltransferase involved in cell wall bisynthesis [Sphingobacterium psychroaquaticum]